MAGLVWFGTRQYAQWIPAPAVDVEAGKVGFESIANFTNGGAFVRRSKAAAKRFSFSWNMQKRADLAPILDFADGIYGDGPFYYLNPFARDRNVCPTYWASPFVNAYDGPLTIKNNTTGAVSRPALFTDTAVTNGYPLESADYTLSTATSVKPLYIPIPPGHRAHIGVTGQLVSGSAVVRVTSLTGAATTATNDMTLLTKAGPLTNFVTPAGITGISISMLSASTGVLRVHGIVVQVLPEGAVSPVGAFISGQGQSGMSFVSQPVTSEYSAALDRVGATAELIETEAWT